MTTLYVTDLDGTLLNNGSFVSQESTRILSELTEEGVLFTVATARTPATVVPLMSEVNTFLPYIVLTGAATFSPRTMTYSNKVTIPPADEAILSEMFDAAGIHPFIYHFADRRLLSVYHYPGMTEAERRFYEPRSRLKLKRFTFERREGDDRETVLFFAIGHRRAIVPLSQQIAATGRFSVSCYPDIFAPDVQLLEVFRVGVSKADAIRRMQEETGADRLVVFGDNLNDLPMLGIADLAVAVSNAQPAVRAAADIVIGPNFDDSVARFIAADFHTNR